MRRWLAVVLLAAGTAFGDLTSTTLMNAQTGIGPGLTSVIAASTPTTGNLGSDRWSFQYHATTTGVKVRLQQSNDSGTTWVTIHTFGASADEIYTVPSCGACIFRPYKPAVTTGTATVVVTVTGTTIAYVESYTPTATATVTPTRTVTKTATNTSTFTVTPTRTTTVTPRNTPTPMGHVARLPTRTATSTPTRTPTRTATPTISGTPTITPTRTVTQTATVTPTATTAPHTLTVNNNLAGAGANDGVLTIGGGATGTCVHQLSCPFTVAHGAVVTVAQTAGGDLGTWSGTGGCTGSTAVPCVIAAMNAAYTVVATY